MKIFANRLVRASVSAAALCLISAPALALDTDAFADRLKAAMNTQGLIVTFAGVEEDGSDIILKGVGVGIPGEDATFPAGTLTLENVEETGNGGYRIGHIEFEDLAFSDQEFAFVAEGMSVDGLILPAEGATGPFGELMLYEGLTVENVQVKVQGKEAFTLQDLTATVVIPETADDKMSFDAGAENILVNFASVDDPKVSQTMAALGYETLSGKLKSTGYWIASTGQMVLEENSISVNDAASLNIQIDLAGYTPQLAMELQKMSRQMQESGGNEQAQGLAMLGLLQQLSFNSAAIRLDDASLTGRLLDFFAAQQGTDRNGLVNQAKGVLPFMLAQLGNPEFAAQITQAVSTYLDDPQSLEVSARPAQAVPFAQLMATGMSAPQTIPDVLSVKVAANH